MMKKMRQITILLVLIGLAVAHTAFSEMSSSSYQINADSINFAGDANSSSASYQMNDTLGEMGSGISGSASYEMQAGYQHMIGGGTISLSCPSSVDMGGITGTGQSALTTNDASCTVITNIPTGYSLSFGSATTYMENATSDQIAAYSPASAGTPEQWSVAASDSEWGARLKKTGTTTYDSSKWGAAAGTEDYAASDVYWHNVTNASGFTVVSRNSETSGSGDTEIIQFGGEVGANKFQPSGTYDVDITITAVSL